MKFGNRAITLLSAIVTIGGMAVMRTENAHASSPLFEPAECQELVGCMNPATDCAAVDYGELFDSCDYIRTEYYECGTFTAGVDCKYNYGGCSVAFVCYGDL